MTTQVANKTENSATFSDNAIWVLLKISWRNVWRSKKRSLIIIAAVVVGLWSGIFLMAYYNGMIQQRVSSAIATEVSHIQLHHPEFRKDYELRFAIPDGQRTLQEIQSLPQVKYAAGRIIVKGMVASASGSCGMSINAVMPTQEDSLTHLSAKKTAGNYFNSQKSNEILVSEKTLHKLKLKLKNKVVLTFQDAAGNLASGAFRIIGTFKTENDPYDDTNVFVNIQDVAALTSLEDQFSEIAVLLKSNDLLASGQSSLQQKFPALEVKNWMEISPELGMTESVSDQLVVVFMSIILLALSFGIINTMLMAVLERTREIGMLLALGMNRAKVFGMIMMETFFLIFAGCPPGILLAFASIAIAHHTGVRLQSFSNIGSNFGFSDVIYPSLEAKQFYTILLLVIITAVISALFPAQRALRLNPSESLRK